MRPHIEELSQIATCYTSAYPNAGLPNAMGEYDEHPEQTAHFIEEWAEQGLREHCGRMLRLPRLITSGILPSNVKSLPRESCPILEEAL